jgi:hypothetical protein
MKIEITGVVKAPYVGAVSKYGTFIGKWADKSPPNVGFFDVELDCGNVIDYVFIEAEKNAEEKYKIETINGKTIIIGLVVEAYDDFIKIIQIGDDVVMVDIKDGSLKNRYVKIELDDISLYPVYY